MSIQQEQERYEVSTWLRMLDFQQQENVYMKTRIAEVVKANVSKEVLDRLEHFQNMLLNKDAVIALVRRDILRLSPEAHDGSAKVSQESLRRDMYKMEQEFNTLRNGFNEYMQMMASS